LQGLPDAIRIADGSGTVKRAFSKRKRQTVTGATAFLAAADSGQSIQLQRQKFLSLFPRRDAFIWKTYDQERWQKATGPLLDAQISGVVSDSGRGLFRGCYWSHKTRHAVLDLDIQSRYHNAAELQKLQAHLSAVGLYAIPYRSSESGGWHLYLPFSDWVESDQVNQTLKTWLKSLGYEIASGQLEIFPSGNALRLPLQKGFAWLNSNGSIKVRREEIREDEAIASFLQDFEENSRNWQVAKTLMESQVRSAGSRAGAGVQEHEKVISLAGFDDLFRKGKIQETWDKGREYWLNGLTAKGQRHEAVLAVGHYLWYGDTSESVPSYPGRWNNETRARLIEAWLRKKHNGFCRHINTEQWKEIEAQIWRAVFWRREKGFQAYSPYPLTDRLLKRLLEVYKTTGRLFEIDRMAEANNTRKDNARKRIAKAIAELEKEGAQITKAEVARRSGAHRSTVAKHSDLLTACLGVSNRGVWGVPSAVLPLGSCHEPVAVFTRILTVGSGSEKQEKTESPFFVLGDSGTSHIKMKSTPKPFDKLETEDGVWGTMERKVALSSKTATVAPLAICPAKSLQDSTQQQDQARRVAAQVLPPGPLESCIPSEGQMGAGGISFIFGTAAGRRSCYTLRVTEYGIKEQSGAASSKSALSSFGAKSKNEKRIPDATNHTFLTTIKQRYSSGLADEFSLISSCSVTLVRGYESVRCPLKANQSGALAAVKLIKESSSWRFSEDSRDSQKPSSVHPSKVTAPENLSSVRLALRRPALWLRGPPG